MNEAFDQLLLDQPELTRSRSLTADRLRRLFGRQKGQCTWCGGDLKNNRRKWHDACVGQFFERCQVSGSVQRVWKRDNGICQLCGRDVRKCERVWKSFHPRYGDRDEYDLMVLALLGHARSGWAEVDHIVPVCEGGGLCRVENLRLVCGVCHAVETRRLAARRAKPKPLKRVQ